jgi:hypothetical protein
MHLAPTRPLARQANVKSGTPLETYICRRAGSEVLFGSSPTHGESPGAKGKFPMTLADHESEKK